ncbi:MAG: hypothetical protein KBA96_06925 [Rhodocyclaceae bacterium]|nr:hypothetical protein [Rhodocyclaceae bacterium]
MSTSKKARRQFLQRLAATSVIGAGGISLLIQNALANGKDPLASGMHKITGDVRVNGVAAKEGMLLKNGDTIETGAKSQAIYVIGKDAFFQRDNTTVNFASGAAADVMRVLTGKILSVFGKGQRTIQTSTATIGIRGTGCYIEDEPALPRSKPVGAGDTPLKPTKSSRTYFCLCYGTVELTPTAMPQQKETYSTKHHDHPLYIHDDPTMATCMVAAPVSNHSDIELALLESLVGRQPPFPSEYWRTY